MLLLMTTPPAPRWPSTTASRAEARRLVSCWFLVSQVSDRDLGTLFSCQVEIAETVVTGQRELLPVVPRCSQAINLHRNRSHHERDRHGTDHQARKPLGKSHRGIAREFE